MKTFLKIMTLIGLSLFILLLIATAILYYLANKTPEYYSPTDLSPSQKQEVSQEFKSRMDSLYLEAVSDKSFNQSYTKEEINKYLISLDEIAQKQSGQKSSIYKKMDEAGFSQPAIHLADGRIIFMVRSHEYNKVLSMELGISSTEDKKIKVDLINSRIGTLDLPKDLLLDKMGLVDTYLDKEKSGQKKSTTIQTGDIAGVMRQLLTGTNKPPFYADIFLGRPLRITDISITTEKIDISFIPIESSVPK